MPDRRMPSLKALRALEATVRLGSIKAAGEELCVTAAAVSQQIKKLEEELDTELLHRGHRSLTATKTGQRLSQSLTSAFGTIQQEVDRVSPSRKSRCLVIACPPPFAAKFLASRIGEFLEAYPELDVRFSVDFEKVDYVSNGIDVGVRLSSVNEEGMVSSEAFQEYKVPLASPEYASRLGLCEPGGFAKATLLEKNYGELIPYAADWSDWYREAGLTKPAHQRTINFEMHCDQAYDAAVAGTGMVMGEVINGSRLITDGKLICPFGPAIPLDLGFKVVAHESIPMDDETLLFRRWLIEQLKSASQLVDEIREGDARALCGDFNSHQRAASL